MSYYGLYIPLKTGAVPVGAGNVGGAAAAAATAGSAVSVGSGAGGEGCADQNAADSPYVFREKIDALKVLKLHKDARLREFSNTDDAVKYVQTGYEVVQTKYNDVKTSTAAVEKAAFRAPTKQELIEFRKVIESGDCEHVKSIIWDNPRYLVSSGDTPTALKEGYRYNAMHVCAISKKPRIAELILQTVSDPDFVDLLTGKKNDLKMCKELAANLLDYYLNIPEKGRSETPLHLAAKNGAAEMVEVLTSYSECKMTPNSEGQLPKEIICSRVPHAAPELFKKIERLLEERFYVPVIRSMDNAVPPLIGQPFSINNPPNFNCDPLSPEVKIQALAGPMNKEQAKKFCRRWKTPPRLGSNTSSPIASNPYISPMKVRTPGRTPYSNRSFDSTTPTLQRKSLFNNTPQRSPLNLSLRFDKQQNGISCEPEQQDMLNGTSPTDQQNGNHSQEDVPTDKVVTESSQAAPNATFQIETNNNQEQSVPNAKPQQLSMLKSALCPRTPLLRQKKDMFFTYREQYASSPVVFDQVQENRNDSIACERDLYDTPGYKERHIKISDTEKGLEVIGRELAKEQNVEWREYWDFLNAFIDIASMDGLQKLENFFAQRVREAEVAKKASQAVANSAVIFDDLCSALVKFGFCKDSDTVDATRNGFYANERTRNLQAAADNVNAPQSTTPYTCVEKSLQVFAKRMTKTILHNIENIVSINDAFLSELKRLKSLICSFKDDTRFLNVNFAKVHSRFANLIANYLENSQDVDAATKSKIQKCLLHILISPGERKEQLHCVCNKILLLLENPIEQILPENLKTEAMCSKAWLAQNECECQWETNLSRKTSRRNRMETRYKHHQQAKHDSAAEKQREKVEKAESARATGNLVDWRNSASGNDSEEDLDDDVFWSDFDGTDTDEDEDVWFTPPDSPSRISIVEQVPTEGDKYDIYVYGNEPTKRDLDVLNAIFHVDINSYNYPNVYNWKLAVLRFPNEDMDYFPSPAVVKKSHSFNSNSMKKEINSPRPSHQQQIQQLPIAKRLFMSPSRQQKQPSAQHQAPSTPLNKIRGLFSAYRERHDSSPMSTSSASPSLFCSERSGSEGSNNLSLLNISASE